jgi:hypothetical protein
VPQVAACGLERPDHLEVRKVRKRVPTAHTLDIFEEEQLLTVCTMENVHALILVLSHFSIT